MRLALFTLFLLAACGSGDGEAAATISEPRTFAERFAAKHGRAPLDYADEAYWACTGDRDDDLCDADYTMARLNTDGTASVTRYERADEPPVDCFFIYPTLDFNVFQGANHENFDMVALPDRTIQAQVGPFQSVCRMFAPYYRQGTFGAYMTRPLDYSAWLFLKAFADVAASFEYYLRHWNHGRPVVIVGHSQGGQHASYLLHSYFDGDVEVTDIPGSQTTAELRNRLVVGMPIGSEVYVEKGKTKGGSFSDLPLCGDDGAPRCVISYQSFTEGFTFEGDFTPALMQRMADEGLFYRRYDKRVHDTVCVNPGLIPLGADRALDWDGHPVPAGDTRILDGTFMVGVMTLLYNGPRPAIERLHLPGRYTATCRHDPVAGGWLAIGYHEPVTGADRRGDPLDIDGAVAHAGLGLHVFDFNLPQGELVRQIAKRVR